MINWRVRFKNKTWVLSFISQILIVVQLIITGFNSIGVIHFQLTDKMINSILEIVNALLIVLSMLGIVQDPTTKGLSDSEQAMQYKEPK